MGDEPSEVHEHFDADGNLTGTTVVTREPEWDDESRNLALDLLEHDRMIHGGCGNHMSESMDPNYARKVDHARAVCQDCRSIDLAREQWHRQSGHSGEVGQCQKCGDEHFYIVERVPIDPTPGPAPGMTR